MTTLKDVLLKLKFCSQIKFFSVDLSYRYIGNEGVESLAKALKQHKTIITFNLKLRGIRGSDSSSKRVTYKRVTYIGVESLVNTIKEFDSITSFALDLRGLNAGPKGTEILASLIRENKTITNFFLDLRANEIGQKGKGIEELTNAIKQNETITSLTLDLAGNGIDDEMLEKLANAIKENKTINSLSINLDYNKISDQGANILTDAIRDNKALVLLSLAFNANKIKQYEFLTTLKGFVERNQKEYHVKKLAHLLFCWQQNNSVLNNLPKDVVRYAIPPYLPYMEGGSGNKEDSLEVSVETELTKVSTARCYLSY